MCCAPSLQPPDFNTAVVDSPQHPTSSGPQKRTLSCLKGNKKRKGVNEPRDTCQLLGDRIQWINSQPPHPLWDSLKCVLHKVPSATGPSTLIKHQLINTPFTGFPPSLPILLSLLPQCTSLSHLPNKLPAPRFLSPARFGEPKLRDKQGLYLVGLFNPLVFSLFYLYIFFLDV